MIIFSRAAWAAFAGLVAGGCLPYSAPAAAAAVPSVTQQQSYFPSDAELHQRLRALVDKGESKGLVLGLIEPDGRRRVIASGDAGPGTSPLSSKTIFEIGSIAKTFTGAILADMVRRGELSLDDPVSKFLPAGVKVPSRNGRQITLLDLATHTSGLPRSPDRALIRDPANPYADIPIKDVYAFLASHELQRDIGAKWEYSNLGYGLLGEALTRAAGAKTFDELVRTRITEPLKMATTRFGRTNPPDAHLAKGHDQQGKVVPYWDFGAFKGTGGLYSNVEDMLSYLDANIGDPRSRIEAAMRDAHQPRHSHGNSGNSQSIGWDHRARLGRTIVYKSGSTGGFAGAVGFDPVSRAGVVVLGNGKGFGSRVDIVIELLSRVGPGSIER